MVSPGKVSDWLGTPSDRRRYSNPVCSTGVVTRCRRGRYRRTDGVTRMPLWVFCPPEIAGHENSSGSIWWRKI